MEFNIDEMKEQYIDHQFDEVEFVVEADDMVAFAEACGESLPHFVDPTAPGFRAVPNYASRYHGRRSLPKGFPVNMMASFDAGKSVEVTAPIHAGDRLTARSHIHDIFEKTGRSGGMFGFEGLGSIYWHMVSKLLLAVQENFHAAREAGAEETVCRRLGGLYYRIREGIGFNKTPSEYGAFPTDPYSHTPKHIGAQQPGMTGQVKEEMMARFAELGVRVHGGAVQFDPSLLREREFLSESLPFRFLDVDGQWQELTVPDSALAFTWCQVPLVYRLDESSEPAVTVTWDNGERQTLSTLALPVEIAEQLFRRNGCIREVELVLHRGQLFAE